MANIVVIDDSIEILAVAEAMLSASGYQVKVFTSGQQAMEALRMTPVDLIVTDIYMPDQDGLEVIRDARRICPHTPIIAMSGVTGLGNMLTPAELLGAYCTLSKPFSRADFLFVVASALSSRPTGNA